jgi:alpha/beta superfamily hydrolase
MIRIVLWVLLAACSLTAIAQDFDREQRWSDEIVPGLVVGDAVWLEGAAGRKFLGLFTQIPKAQAAILLVHGIGVHPDHGVIGTLRAGLADRGYTTLSIQMPVLNADAGPRDYQPLYANAVMRIRAAAAWLREKSGLRTVLLSHSLGSAMSSAYFEQSEDAPFSAWVCMGLGGGFGNMRNVKGPVLDVYGEKDLPGVLRSDWRRRITVESIPGSRQVKIAQADHFYSGRESVLAMAVDDFIRAQVLR